MFSQRSQICDEKKKSDEGQNSSGASVSLGKPSKLTYIISTKCQKHNIKAMVINTNRIETKKQQAIYFYKGARNGGLTQKVVQDFSSQISKNKHGLNRLLRG